MATTASIELCKLKFSEKVSENNATISVKTSSYFEF